MPIIYYALVLRQQARDTEYLFQLLHSLYSLREQNREIPVYLHLARDPGLVTRHFLAAQLGVRCICFNGYAGLLDAFYPGAGAVLGDFPLLFKFLSLVHIRDLDPDQVLYVDPDTYFFKDPALLLARYRDADLYAREEAYSFGSLTGYLPEHLDQERYQALLASEGCSYVKPFNTGVMVFNQGSWLRLLEAMPQLVEYVLRFTRDAGLTDQAVPFPDAITALPPLDYPSENQWLREQIACWLTLGRLPGFSLEQLVPDELLQGCEEALAPGRFARPTLSHYFTRNSRAFFEQLAQENYRE
ncbi:MAG TPA: hypothetical protein V6D23_11905 [Candidatus Obscuribacterales bacterium]